MGAAAKIYAPKGLSWVPQTAGLLLGSSLAFHSRLADVLRNGTNEGFTSKGIVTFFGKIKCFQILTAQVSSNEGIKEENMRGP